MLMDINAPDWPKRAAKTVLLSAARAGSQANIGMVLPDPGFWAEAQALCRRHGLAIAVLATVLGPQVTPAGIPYIIGALVVGLFAAKKGQMTQMPELVALMQSLAGLASHVDTSTGFPTEAEKAIHEVEIYVGILIGAVTFSGSIIAFCKSSRARSAASRCCCRAVIGSTLQACWW